MKYRKLTIKQYHDVMKHCHEFGGFGVNEAVLQSHNMLFPDDKVVVPQQISFTPEQQKRLQYLMDTMCDLIENTQQELEFHENSVTLPVSNFEIITLKFVK